MCEVKKSDRRPCGRSGFGGMFNMSSCKCPQRYKDERIVEI